MFGGGRGGGVRGMGWNLRAATCRRYSEFKDQHDFYDLLEEAIKNEKTLFPGIRFI